MTAVSSIAALKSAVFRAVEGLVRSRGYELIRPEAARPPSDWICLNVGSGGQTFPGFTNLDVASEHYDSSRAGPFVEYDMRSGLLPYSDSSVDLIYCSHVIEHVEDEHAIRFIRDSARVLRPGGVLRIACPDAAFLWQVSSFPSTYWTWRWAHMDRNGVDPGSLAPSDFLLREICTPKFGQWIANGRRGSSAEVEWSDDGAEIARRLDDLTKDQAWEEDRIGQHINWWSFEKLASITGEQFQYTVRSRYRGSVSRYMRTCGFDLTCPEMSLYVDCVR